MPSLTSRNQVIDHIIYMHGSKGINKMPDDIVSPILNKTETKLTPRKNVIPITSISDLGTVVGEIQNQLGFLIGKINNEVSPEFKALMEGYVNKANEAEEYKVHLENISSTQGDLKAEINKIRETNRNLIQELQMARELLTKLELELANFQESSKRSEEDYKERIKKLIRQNQDFENKTKRLEEEKLNLYQEMEGKIAEKAQIEEKVRQELLDLSFNSHQKEQTLTIERDNLKKQVEEFDSILREHIEKIELKTKEAEYKDALLNQLIKKSATDKLKKELFSEKKDSKEFVLEKKKSWFF